MGAIASQITSLTIVFSTVYLGTDQRKHQSSASLAFVRGIPRRPVYSPHKWPVTWKMFPFDDVIMTGLILGLHPANERRRRRRYFVTMSPIGWCKPRISPVTITTFSLIAYTLLVLFFLSLPKTLLRHKKIIAGLHLSPCCSPCPCCSPAACTILLQLFAITTGLSLTKHGTEYCSLWCFPRGIKTPWLMWISKS